MAVEVVVFVQGHKNDENGVLTEASIARCEGGVRRFLAEGGPERARLICCGGKGPGFNKTPTDHSIYLEKVVESFGVLRGNGLVVPGLPATQTANEVLLCVEWLLAHDKKGLFGDSVRAIMVTSDFHVDRTALAWSLIAEKLLEPGGLRVNMEVVGTDTTAFLSGGERNKVLEHERLRLSQTPQFVENELQQRRPAGHATQA